MLRFYLALRGQLLIIALFNYFSYTTQFLFPRETNNNTKKRKALFFFSLMIHYLKKLTLLVVVKIIQSGAVNRKDADSIFYNTHSINHGCTLNLIVAITLKEMH